MEVAGPGVIVDPVPPSDSTTLSDTRALERVDVTASALGGTPAVFHMGGTPAVTIDEQE